VPVAVPVAGAEGHLPVHPNAELGAWLQQHIMFFALVLLGLAIYIPPGVASWAAPNVAPEQRADQEAGARAVGDELRLVLALRGEIGRASCGKEFNSRRTQAGRKTDERITLAIRHLEPPEVNMQHPLLAAARPLDLGHQ